MSGFSGPEKFTLLVSVEAPPWVSRDVRSVLCRMIGLSDEERRNVFETKERALAAGLAAGEEVLSGINAISDEPLDVAKWLSVVPLVSFSFG